MASKVNRRSVNAVIEYIQLIRWAPEAIYFVGVGTGCEDAVAFREQYPESTIVGFEPNPDSFKNLTSFPGWLHQTALGDESSIKTLYYRRHWKNGSSLYRPDDSKRVQTAPVSVHRLDEYKTSSVKTLLWVDAEGYELEIFKGGRRFLEDVEVVNVEMTGMPRGDGWAYPIEIHRELVSQGFSQAFIHTIRPCINQFDSIYLRKEMIDPNFVTCLASIQQETRKESSS